MARPLKLLLENDIKELRLIHEQQNPASEKKFLIEGPFMVSEVENANKRKYKKEVLDESVNRYIKESIEKHCAVGELEHSTKACVDPNNICHKIISLIPDGNIWVGKSIVTRETPKGSLLYGLMSEGIRMGVSSKGVGAIDGGVVDEYKLISCDVVFDPSGPGCYVDPIVESKNFMISEHGDIVEIAYSILESTLSHLPSNSDEKKQYMIDAIKELLKSI